MRFGDTVSNTFIGVKIFFLNNMIINIIFLYCNVKLFLFVLFCLFCLFIYLFIFFLVRISTNCCLKWQFSHAYLNCRQKYKHRTFFLFFFFLLSPECLEYSGFKMLYLSWESSVPTTWLCFHWNSALKGKILWST